MKRSSLVREIRRRTARKLSQIKLNEAIDDKIKKDEPPHHRSRRPEEWRPVDIDFGIAVAPRLFEDSGN